MFSKALTLPRLFNISEQNKERALNVGLIFCLMLVAYAAKATGNDDFDAVVSRLKEWSEGSMGKMFALGALAVGLAVAVVKQSLMAVVVAVGIALTASIGPDVIINLFGASASSFKI